MQYELASKKFYQFSCYQVLYLHKFFVVSIYFILNSIFWRNINGTFSLFNIYYFCLPTS